MSELQGEILDVGGPADDEVPEAPGPSRRSSRPLLIAVLVFALGALAGGSLMQAKAAEAPSTPPVRLSLGAQPGGVDGWRDGGVVLVVGAVATNDGSAPLSVTGLRVRAGGAFVSDRVAGPLHTLPVLLAPGETRNLPFALITDCATAREPVPSMIMTVRDHAGRRWDVKVHIPDLDQLWAQTQTAPGCATGNGIPALPTAAG